MKSSLRAVLFVFLVGLLPASPVVSAQGVGASADLTGTVTDPSGAALPNARVTAIDTARGEQRSVVTNENGSYRLSGLAPANYKVSAEHSGFQTAIASAVTLSVGQTIVLDFRLSVGFHQSHRKPGFSR